MHIYTRAGALPFRTFSFPDGQRQFVLEAVEHEFKTATIEAALRTTDDLMDVLLAKDVLDANGYITSLDIRYLHGARMDRRINLDQPFTLEVVGRVLMGAGFRQIRVLDPHSPAACRHLRAEPVYPIAVVNQLLSQYHPDSTVVIAPDAGANDRVWRLVRNTPFMTVQGHKHRDPETGVLSGFSVENHEFVKGKTCLILDDICDGGGTFTGLGNALLEAGGTSVDLFVTHGIFSKGTILQNITRIFTTDSLYNTARHDSAHVVVFPVQMKEM